MSIGTKNFADLRLRHFVIWVFGVGPEVYVSPGELGFGFAIAGML